MRASRPATVRAPARRAGARTRSATDRRRGEFGYAGEQLEAVAQRRPAGGSRRARRVGDGSRAAPPGGRTGVLHGGHGGGGPSARQDGRRQPVARAPSERRDSAILRGRFERSGGSEVVRGRHGRAGARGLSKD